MPAVVKSGDTLSRIARDAGTTVAELVALNPEITDPNLIRPGQEIRLPADAAPDEAAPAVPAPGEAPVDPEQATMDELVARFPLAATLMALDPELASIVENAAREDWAADLLEQRLRGSEWWRSRSDAQRQFDIEEQSDPASVQAQIAAVKAELGTKIGQFGVVVDDAELDALARDTVRSGYSETQVNAVLLAPDRETTGSGTVDVIRDGLGDIAQAYLVDVAPDVLERRAFDIQAGRDTREGFRLWAENQAMSAYGGNAGLVAALERGLTVEDWADPYRQLAARELELPSTGVSLADPKFRDAILSDGLSLGEFRQRIREDDRFGWSETVAARDEAFGLVSSLLEGFGKIA